MDYAPLSLRFPVGGLVKRYGFQAQPAGTTGDALNVWPDETSAGRERGGTRPGLDELVPSGQPGDGDDGPVRCLVTANVAGEAGYERVIIAVLEDKVFRRDTDGSWTQMTGTISSTTGQLFAVQHFQTVYFADYNSGQYYELALGGDAVNATTGSGKPPDCTLVASWHERLVWAGDPDDPHAWFMSAAGDPDDYDYGEDIPTAAASGAQFELGRIGEPITALIPHNRKCIIFGCTDSMYVMRGDPVAERGYIEVLSHEFGPITGSAWCKAAGGTTVFLTRDGLYVMPDGCGESPTSLSREKLPEELVNIDPGDNTVLLAYDVMLRAIHIWVTPSSGDGTHWLYDWENGGFWPVTVPTGMQPTAICEHTPLGGEGVSSVILGGKDEFIRQFRRAQTDDDGTDFDSYVLLGPVPLSESLDDNHLITESQFLGEAVEGTFTHTIQTGDTAELAASAQRTFTPASNTYRSYPRLRGQSVAVKVESSGELDSAWLMEGVTLRVAPARRVRW